MTNEQKQVRHFMAMFVQETPNTPIIPSSKVIHLRAKLILEEALETIWAMGLAVRISDPVAATTHFWLRGPEDLDRVKFFHFQNPNINLIADGLADLHYVGYCGTGVAFGIDMEPKFQKVHEKNMAKFWTEEEVKRLNDSTERIVIQVRDNFFIVKDSHGKVVKSPSFTPPELNI